MPKRRLIGIVISDKMEKTCVVEVELLKMHKKYARRFTIHESYKAHNENNEYKTGDKVTIEETRPLSKDKRWKVVGKAA
ncbi:MAG: 30S ribosomal protein S17 [Candidatus Wildermuthbacteria bacterium]|nr:30S ribosomal protein S17 [Candidatus Wildermuthbacteria bacterium]